MDKPERGEGLLNSVLEEGEYETMLEHIRKETGESGFPYIIECMKPNSVTLDQIKEMIVRLNMDTGLDVSFNVGLNGDRGMVHCVMVVDELPEDKNRNPRLLQ